MKQTTIFCCIVAILILCTSNIFGDDKKHKNHGRDLKSPPTTVRFGSRSMGCAGRGICNASVVANPKLGVAYDTFIATDNSTFTSTWVATGGAGDPSGEYFFDCPYDVSVNNPAFSGVANWPYATGTIVPAGHRYAITTSGTEKTMTMTTVNSTPVSIQLILGDNNNGYDNTTMGVYSITNQPLPANGNTPASICATMGLKPGAADTIFIAFKDDSVKNYQAAMKPMIANFAANGGFACPLAIYNWLQLNNSCLSGLHIPASSYIGIGQMARVVKSTYDTLYFAYNYLPLVYSLTFSNITASSFTVNWDDSWPNYTYQGEYSISEDMGQAITFTVDNPGSATITGLSPATTYYVKIGVTNSNNINAGAAYTYTPNSFSTSTIGGGKFKKATPPNGSKKKGSK